MQKHDERDAQAMVELRRKLMTRQISRRDVLRGGAALGLSASALAATSIGPAGRVTAQEATPATALGSYEGRTLRVSIALAEDEVPVFEEVVVDGFKNATGGDVEIIKIEAADVIRTLEAQVGSGNVEIDLLTQDNNSLAPLVSGELVEQLPEAQQIIPAETIPALLDVLKFNDQFYFLPARPNVQITYYNENRFNEWSLQPPKTWDELSAAAKTIRENSGVGKVSIQGVPGGPVGVTVTQFLWQAGGDPLTINNDAGVQAFTFLQNLKPDLTPQYPTATFDTTNTYLLNESVVLAQNWPFGINVIVDQGGKKEIKTYEGWAGPAGSALVLGGDVLGVVKGTPNRDMALDFAKVFASLETQSQLTARLGWPAIRSDAFGEVQDWQQPYFQTVSAALQIARARPNVTYWLQVEQVLSDAFNDIVTNGSDVKSTLDNYQGQIDQLKSEAGG
jgi:trehalose transport system substrate-binding protein